MLGRSRVVLTALLAGCVLVAAEPARAQASAFGPGEQSTYRMHWLGITAGTTRITVGAQTEQWGRPVWPLVAIGQTESFFRVYPIRDRFISYWDTQTQSSVGSEFHQDENKVRRRMRVRFNAAEGKAMVLKQKEGQPSHEATVDVPPGVTDVAAATFALRNKPLAVGQRYEMPVFTGTRVITMRADVVGTETLDTTLGRREVFKLRVQTEFTGRLASRRDMHVYLTMDEARVPVRIEADLVLGKVVAELSDYQEGRRMAVAPPLQSDS
ncbi:MAG: DUF3108 domain-containing protein [Myxococcaceae bacterium]|nr:DUF3108 domain-containing protein [Myxococcaceae bacterium]